MQVSAVELAQLLQGKIIGASEVKVSAPSRIEEGKPGTISFLANPKYEPYIYSTEASIVLVHENFVPKQKVAATLIQVKDVYASVGLLLQKFESELIEPSGLSDLAFISPKSNLGQNVSVGAFSVIAKGVNIGEGAYIFPQVYVGKNVKIGAGVRIYPGVKIYAGCTVGDHCVIHSNAIIGSDGFGFATTAEGDYTKIPQIGNVILEDHVEIGANTVVDRATMGSTIIRSGSKLDNLIQVAHNVEIGENTAIAAQTGIAGSAKIGKRNQIGGQVGIAGHLRTADGVMIQAQSGIASSIDESNSKWFGYPAIPYHQYLKSYVYFKKLPEIASEIKKLNKKITELESQLNQTKSQKLDSQS